MATNFSYTETNFHLNNQHHSVERLAGLVIALDSSMGLDFDSRSICHVQNPLIGHALNPYRLEICPPCNVGYQVERGIDTV